MPYFSGIDATISIERKEAQNPITPDVISIEFSAVNSSRPLYTPGSDIVDAFMHSNAMVQGTLVLNHTDTDINILQDNDNITIDYDKIEPILQKEGIYKLEGFVKSYSIEEVQVISENHSLSPITDNLTDIYQFIGKELVSI